MRSLKDRLTYANVAATLALVASLTGVAWAATTAPKNSVVSKSIKDGQVKSADLADNAVTQPKLADDAVGINELGDNSVTGSSVVDNSLTGNDIADNAIGADEFQGPVEAGELGTDSVTDGSVPNLLSNLIAVTPANSWAAVNGGPFFGVDNEHVVHLVGSINGGGATNNTVAFTLPTQARPLLPTNQITGCAGSGLAAVAVATNGDVTINSLSGPTCQGGVSLDQVTFMAST